MRKLIAAIRNYADGPKNCIFS